MSGFENPITGGQGALLRSAIKSPDYSPGVMGWSINKDGTAEFNDLTIRGTFYGSDFIISSSGVFLYAGTPAAGNLIISIAPAAGSDAFGNTFPAGINVSGGGLINIPAASGSDVSLTSEVFGDAFARFVLAVDGTMNWGSGAASADTSLFRPQTNQLNTQGTFGIGLECKIGTYLVRELTSGDATTQVVGVGAAAPYAANWSAATSFGTLTPASPLFYRFDGEDNLIIGGAFQAGATAPGTAVFMLPAASGSIPSYRPAKPWPVPMTKISGGVSTPCMAFVSSAGNLNLNSQLGSTVTAGAQYYISPTAIPLGIMP